MSNQNQPKGANLVQNNGGEKAKTESTPAAELKTQEPPKVQEVKEERMVRVMPRKDVPRCRIGADWYSFRKGKSQEVPKGIVNHLESRNII